MRALVGVMALCVFSLSAVRSDWPNFLGPNRDGISPETGINKNWKAKEPKILWKTPMGDNGYAGPSVAGGKVFIIDHKGSDDIVRAIDLQTGQDVWTFSYPDMSRHNYGFSHATPTVDGGHVYTMSGLGKLHCLTAADGKKVWVRDIVRELGGKVPEWQVAASPVIDGDRIIVLPGGHGACVAALDKKTGQTIWKGGGDDAASYATPVVATLGGRKQYIVFSAGGLLGVDPADGKLLWRFPWKTSYDVNAATPIVVSDDTIFVTSGYGRGCALVKVAGGRAEAVWENKAMQSHFSTPVLSAGHIYGTSDRNRTVCLEAATGKIKWEEPGGGKGGVIAVDGTLISVDGSRGVVTMMELSPNGFRPLGQITPLGGQSWTAPIVADGRLLLRNKQALVCLDLR